MTAPNTNAVPASCCQEKWVAYRSAVSAARSNAVASASGPASRNRREHTRTRRAGGARRQLRRSPSTPRPGRCPTPTRARACRTAERTPNSGRLRALVREAVGMVGHGERRRAVQIRPGLRRPVVRVRAPVQARCAPVAPGEAGSPRERDRADGDRERRRPRAESRRHGPDVDDGPRLPEPQRRPPAGEAARPSGTRTLATATSAAPTTGARAACASRGNRGAARRRRPPRRRSARRARGAERQGARAHARARARRRATASTTT